ncbi:MAG: ATP-binding protein [Oscillospiraceae bacterium]|nr:ATP-binding protein [Oscillospiraceae bacterium]
MLYGLEDARANIRNRDGRRVFYLGKGDQLTSDARDWLGRERIEILPADKARPDRYRLLSGGFLEEKPERMTHLFGDVLVEKTHPRIAFRGAVDLLEAEILLCALEVPKWEQELREILALVRQLLRCEVMGEPLAETPLCGMDAKALRERSHRPQDFYGQPHFMPSVADEAAVLRLNKVRCAVRHTELMAVAAMPDREDIIRALNRMSSFVYILMIREKAGK